MSVDTLLEWLLDGAPDATSGMDLVHRIAAELDEDDIVADRIGFVQTETNPVLIGRGNYWARGGESRVSPLRVEDGSMGGALKAISDPSFANSPILTVFSTRRELRVEIANTPASEGDFGIITELRARGFTDYIALPLLFRSGDIQLLSLATRRPGGFGDAAIVSLRRVARSLARVAETMSERDRAQTLLETYVGPHSASRVLAGRIRRGDVESIRAVIWFSDLRGFTAASTTRAPEEMIGVLNDLFECQLPAIEKHGGEVLKFIGDGLLAIFPCTGPTETEERCAAALRSADEALAALALRTASAVPLNIGVALHVGEVAYGNIGGAKRLDFTAIGAAVNLAARLEGLTGKLERHLVVSEAFATGANRPMTELGAFDLKGFPEKQKVFAPMSISTTA